MQNNYDIVIVGGGPGEVWLLFMLLKMVRMFAY